MNNEREVKDGSANPVTHADDLVSRVLTLEDVKQFVNAKAIVHDCPSCTQNSWDILVDPSGEYGYMGLNRNGMLSVPPPFIPCILVICKVCGYVKTLAKRSVMNYLDRDQTDDGN